MRPSHLFLVLGVLLTEPGCLGAGAGRYHDLQRDWERTATTAEGAASADDPLARMPELEREALVRGVLARNPTIRASRHAWRAALERYPQVTSLDDPMLGIGAAPRSFGSSKVDDAPVFDLSQKLPFPGKLALRGNAALAEAEAAAEDLVAVRLRLATMASVLFDEYYLAARSLEINAEHIALLEEFQRIATARYETGEASQQDPIQAEVERTQADRRHVVLGTQQRVIAEQINALLHRRPELPLPPAPRELVLPDPLSKGVAPLVEAALEQRPELRAADARVRAEEARVDLARREFLPDFTLVGALNQVMQERDLQPFVGIQLNVPLRLGRRRAALEEAKAQLERSRSQLVALEDEVQFGVRSGLDRLAEAHEVLSLFQDRLVPASRDQVDAARSGFETGRNSFLALIDAERSLRNIELGLEEALTEVTRRRAELDRALGRLPGLDWGRTTP